MHSPGTATVKCVPNFALCLFSVVEVMAGGDTLTVDPNQMWDKHVSFTNLLKLFINIFLLPTFHQLITLP